MYERFDIVSPVNNKTYTSREYVSDSALQSLLSQSAEAQRDWVSRSVTERIDRCSSLVKILCDESAVLGEQLTWTIGRPVSQTCSEFNGVQERSQCLLDMADGVLASTSVPSSHGELLRIERVPCGIVLVVTPWNYPYLTTVNSLIPALVSGNSVILKASPQTPMSAEHWVDAAEKAGIPRGVLCFAHCTIAQTQTLVSRRLVNHVVFTGSVPVGRVIGELAGRSLTGCTLELGGKDAAYVRSDADIESTAAALANGAFYNAGQSCCAIERIYVDERIYPEFIDALVDQVGLLRLGDPRDPATSLGPVVSARAAARIRGEIARAISQGAEQLLPSVSGSCPEIETYIEPSILINVRQDMPFMQEEIFGPTVGVAAVRNDDDAIERINDSALGLSASVWTTDVAAAETLGARIETGTWFLNRCDYLAPSLPWSGRKNSGVGCSLSSLGFLEITRPKSVLLKRCPYSFPGTDDTSGL